MARLLLRGASLDEALPGGRAAPRPRARAALGGDRAARRSTATSAASPCRWAADAARHAAGARRRCARGRSSACASASSPRSRRILGAAIEREALQREVVETSALRRSDVLKTALLRAVSHDLRSPLTAILTAGERARLAARCRRRARASWSPTSPARRERLVAPRRQPARHVAPGGAHGRAARRVVLGRGGAAAAVDDVALPPGTLRARDRPRPAADPRRRRAARARVRQPAGERGALLGRPSGLGARPRRRRAASSCASSTAGPASRPPSRSGSSSRSTARRAIADGHRGSGLGLAIVRGFVEANGGRVWVESLPGQGATFVVELPVEEAPA